MNDMLDLARLMLTRAHVPYSRFPVAAVLRSPSGALHASPNVENAAYPLSSCAEAGAVSALVAAGETTITEILVMGGAPGDGLLCSPCGGCRQRLAEFADPATPVHICGPEGLRLGTTLGELLPLRFGPANLAATNPAEGG